MREHINGGLSIYHTSGTINYTTTTATITTTTTTTTWFISYANVH